MNYEPNPHASSLRRQKSKTIAVVIPEIANNFFTLAINGIESVAQEKGYHVLIYLTHEDYPREVSFLKHLHNGRVDGLLMSLSSTTTDYTHLTELQTKDIPVILFDRVSDAINTIKITTDDYDSGYQATRHLIEMGCDKIAYLMISKSLSIGTKRMEGYIQAMKDHDLSIEKEWIIYGSNDNEENLQMVCNLLKGSNRPNGLFASVERLAISAYQACEQLSLRVPEHVKIISFSNLEIAAWLNPSLTTITQPAFDMGQKAATILFKALEKKSFTITDETIILKSTLNVRKSTGG